MPGGAARKPESNGSRGLYMTRYAAVVASVALVWCGMSAGQAYNEPPEQVNVSVKILEFQSMRGVETGFSAYFDQREVTRPYGRISDTGRGVVSTADLTFPTSGAASITVFLDRITSYYGDIEMVLQALVDENRAFILSRPRAMVRVGSETPTTVKTVEQIPYESTEVAGTTTVQITQFRDTGVSLELTAPEVVTDDGDWTTEDDIYINLDLYADVKELGQQFVVALDDRFQGDESSLQQSQITAPEFVSRSINTNVWVRHGQVLVLGGLYRNTKTQRLDTVPWLAQGEDMVFGLAEQVVPGTVGARPVSATIGGREETDQRRELVFLIKAEAWRPAFTVADEHMLVDPDPGEAPAERGHADVIRDVVEGVGGLMMDSMEGITSPVRDELYERDEYRVDD